MASRLITCSFYQKLVRYNIFQYEISDQINYLRTSYDNLKKIRKIKFQWEKYFEKNLTFASFHPILNLKMVLILEKIG